MNVIVVGAGKIGITICEQLTLEDYNVTVIDTDADALEAISALDVITVQGSGVSISTLQRANVAKCDLLVAVTPRDALNILCCSIARRLGVTHAIARVRSPEFSELLSLMQREWGLSMTINPELAAAKEISRIIRFPSAAKIESFAKGKVDIVEFKLSVESPLCGVSLSQLRKLYKYKVLVCAVRRGSESVIPGGDFVLQAGDIVSLTGSDRDVELFLRAVGAYRKRIKDVLIVGGGRIAYYLAAQLLETGTNLTVIERDPKSAMNLAEYFENLTVIQGDGAEQELLLSEGLQTADAFVALTGIDEENAILSMYAMRMGVEKVIVKMNRQNYVELARGAGLESIISPKNITATNILRYARATNNSAGLEIETLHRIADDSVEALEFHVREESEITNVQLKDLQLKKNTLLACITRNGKILIPTGTDEIRVGDNVIVVTTKTRVKSIKDILKS